MVKEAGWWNSARLRGELDYRTSVEIEHVHYSDLETTRPAITGQ